MLLPIKNINKEIGIIKMNQIKITELKSIITEMNSLEEFKSRFYLAEINGSANSNIINRDHSI